MTKKTGVFFVQIDLSNLVLGDEPTNKPKTKTNLMTIEKAIETITKQMVVSGFRERTIGDYRLNKSDIHLYKKWTGYLMSNYF